MDSWTTCDDVIMIALRESSTCFARLLRGVSQARQPGKRMVCAQRQAGAEARHPDAIRVTVPADARVNQLLLRIPRKSRGYMTRVVWRPVLEERHYTSSIPCFSRIL